MRDLAVFGLFAVGIFYALKSPYYGVLLWSLFNYMNPHRLTWGPAFNFPFVYIIAIITIFSFLLSKEKRPFPMSLPLFLWLCFLIWMVITTIFALKEPSAQEQLIKVIKIQIPVLMTLFLFYTRERLETLLAVITFSIAFYGVKGGIFTVLTGGSHIVWGPPGSLIYGNNELAVATLTVLPLLFYFYRRVEKVWVKRLLLVSGGLMLVSAIGTQSRGAFLALVALGGYFWWRSRNKLAWGVSMVLLVVIGLAVVPESWKERMSTIQNYEEDASAQGRIRAWKFAYHLASARLTGGGFNPWNRKNYLEYLPGYDPKHQAFVAHSIYFGVLGEHGWPGLVLYLGVMFLTWVRLGQVIKRTRGDPERQWMADMAEAIKIGMVAYFVGGAFLSLAYFDLPWHFVAIGLILARMSREVEDAKHGAPEAASLRRPSTRPMPRYR